jgi:hypothetical protein
MKPATVGLLTVAALIIIAEFGWDVYRSYRSYRIATATPVFRIHAANVRMRNGAGHPSLIDCPACAGRGLLPGIVQPAECRSCRGRGLRAVADLPLPVRVVGDDEPVDYAIGSLPPTAE